MASDHQTQAGKPQALNPKVGATREGAGGPAELLYQTRFPFCRIGVGICLPGLPLSASAPPWASVSPTGSREADSDPQPAGQNSQHHLPALGISFFVLSLPPAPYCP